MSQAEQSSSVVDQAVASGGSYDVLAKRLATQGETLESLVRQLNDQGTDPREFALDLLDFVVWLDAGDHNLDQLAEHYRLTPAQALRKKADYMAAMNFAFPEDAWIFLTGDQDSIKRFMDSLGFPFIRIGKGNFSHPLAVIVTAPPRMAM